MTPEVVNEPNFEKQMRKQIGCMAGFLQIFDRHQIMIGKRLYSAKRLTPSQSADSTSESDKSPPASPAFSGDLGKRVHSYNAAAPSPSKGKQITVGEMRSPMAATAAELKSKSSRPFSIVELKEGNRSPWKFGKDAPRLSLDSRAATDAKGSLYPTDGSQHHRSPSVIARLMGLEPLPDAPGSESERKPELRRSASESRVSKDLNHSRISNDGSNFYFKQQIQSPSTNFNNAVRDETPIGSHYADQKNHPLKNGNKTERIRCLNKGYPNSTPPWGGGAPPQRKSFFDSGDIFPEPKQTVSIYGEIEKRLRTVGINEQSTDLETLKQILEALQLKGLLHPQQPSHQSQVRHRNFVYDESPIILLKSSGATPTNRRMGNDYSSSNVRSQLRGIRRNYAPTGETSPSQSPQMERNVRSPTRSTASRSSSPNIRRSEGNASPRRLNNAAKPLPSPMESQRKLNQPPPNRRPTPVHSPKINSNRSSSSKKSAAGNHQKEKITTIVVEDEYSSASGSSSAETERSNWEDHKEKESRGLLERCDKLLHSIAEMAASDTQPSPVSVLDPSLYKDEVLTPPSPVTTKRSINFQDQLDEADEEIWSSAISPIRSKCIETSDDSNFIYISDILRASHYLPDSNIFLLLEKQQYLKGNDMSESSKLKRKLIFDTVNEILDRCKCLPPWNDNGSIATPSGDMVWSEFQRIQATETSDDLFDTICGMLKKDLAGDAATGWGSHLVQMSEAVLDLERLIFKDLICESIQDLAISASASRGPMMSRRKLVF
ncbi:protein LONGIFOLIA 1-like [Andrographis paniculata]|uniref:protein LONGIFOLIA 1-like n=1 Tax=Andrographis paniculata TaxID=175694 RepID=UPI0021E8D90B|nr:protein LONGIFOLIA 1-like [Andrographis paniculata]